MNLLRQIGFQTDCLYGYDLKSTIVFVRKMNFKSIEIGFNRKDYIIGSHGVWPWEDEQKKVLLSLLKDFNFKGIHAPFYDLLRYGQLDIFKM